MIFEITTVKVQDYEKWKTTLFDKLPSILKRNGAKCRRLFRDLDNPSIIFIIIDGIIRKTQKMS